MSVEPRRTLSRRTLVHTAAWAAPVISVAAAAPAFATTAEATNDLVFVANGSGAVATVEEGVVFHDFEFSGASLLVGGTPTAGAQLRLTVTFTPPPGSHAGASELYVLGAPAGWVSAQIDRAVTTVTYLYGGPVTHGLPIVIDDGIYFGSNYANMVGTFHLAFAIDGLTPDAVSFAAPALSPGLRSARPDRPISRSSTLRRDS